MSVILSPLLQRAQLLHGFSTREGGVSAPPFDTMNLARSVGDDEGAVAENHRRFARAVGHTVEALVEVSQVHGARCVDADPFVDPIAARREEADALVCATASRAIGVRTADCVPILVGDPEARVVAAIHAGWRGAVGGVVPRAIEALVAKGASPSRLVAAIGPHIRLASFEVGDEVVRAIEEAMPGARERDAIALAGPLFAREPGRRARASLATLVVAQLLEAGLARANVEDVGGDTCAEPARFHSHRRDGARSGRHLAVIVVPGP